MKILLTDADGKHALAAIRSLGRKGHTIIAGSHLSKAQGFYSRYCSEHLIYPHPHDEIAFTEYMQTYLRKNPVDVIIPIGFATTCVFSKHKSEFLLVTHLPIADWSAVAIASDKLQTHRLAQSLGIRIPRIYENIAQIEHFPIVIKGIKAEVRYANAITDLQHTNLSSVMLQDYITGEGYGFYALYNHGTMRAYFMHHRIREYPITGGASSAAESINDPILKNQGKKLLDALCWHGVAMVEFKKDAANGEYVLMEINPKFWGSLDLSIIAGVDFPNLLVQMDFDGEIDPVTDYRIGVRCRWLFPDDVMHLFAKPSAVAAFIFDFFRPSMHHTIRLNDLLPNLFQIYMTICSLMSRLRHRSLRFPQGKPQRRQ